MFNYSPILNQSLGMAQMLSMGGGPLISSGVIIATTLVEILNDVFGPGGDDAMTDAMTQLGTSLESHMDDLFTQLTLDLQQLKMDDAKDVVSGLASEVERDKTAIQLATAQGSTLADLTSAVSILVQNAKAALNGESPICQVIEFATDNGGIKSNYATLPLLLSAVLGLSNYCKYASTVQLMLDAQNYLAYQQAQKNLKPNQQPPPKVNPASEQHGDVLFFNTSIFCILQQTLAFAQPLVQAINTAVTQRQQAADAAASSVQISSGWLWPRVPDDPARGSTQYGYGQLSQSNLSAIAMLRNAQLRRNSWLTSTAGAGLCLFSYADTLNLNYILSTLNDTANSYYSKLPADPQKPLTPPASSLTGIYPAPQPHIVQTGDTLSALASQYHTTVRVIMQLNNLTNPNLITVGQKLTIPGA
jgi:hypothetical protein